MLFRVRFVVRFIFILMICCCCCSVIISCCLWLYLMVCWFTIVYCMFPSQVCPQLTVNYKKMHAFDCDVYQVKCVKFCIRFSVWFMYCNGKCVLKSVKLKMPAILVLWLGVTVEWRIKMVSLVIWAILNRFLLKFKIAYIKFNRLHYTTFLHLSLSHFFFWFHV